MSPGTAAGVAARGTAAGVAARGTAAGVAPTPGDFVVVITRLA
jgi:hypothetical protein